MTYGGLSIRKQQLRQFLNVILEILALNIQRLVSYSESRIKLTKQKLFSADCFCSFLPKFQIFWREIVRSPPLMALPSLCLDIAHNYFDFKDHLKMGANHTISIIKTNFDSSQRTQSSLSNCKQSFCHIANFFISRP